jgi:hypothetical protein
VQLHLILVDQVVVVVMDQQLLEQVERGQETLDILEQQTKHLQQMDGVTMVVVDIPPLLRIILAVAAVALYKLVKVLQIHQLLVLEVMGHRIQ